MTRDRERGGERVKRTLTGSVVAAAVGWFAVGWVGVSSAGAWDSAGHRTITFLAMDGFAGLAPDRPAFLSSDTSRQIAAFQASEADRYRGVRHAYLKHENDPDHFLDVEDLEKFGLTLETIPPLRYEYLRAMAISKHEHPELADGDPSLDLPPYNPRRDTAKTQEFPGYGAHAVMRHHGKLIAAFRTYRSLERLNDSARGAQMEAARANILHEMGQLSHFVGDLAQPLHTTRHFNGWVGKNPHGYTTDKGFHAYIDGGVVSLHNLNYATLRDRATFDRRIDEADPFKDVLEHIRRSHARFEELYILRKSGELDREAGKELIAERLLDGASMLAAMYVSAWRLSELTQRDQEDFLRYEGLAGEPGGPERPAKKDEKKTDAGAGAGGGAERKATPEEAERAWEGAGAGRGTGGGGQADR